MTKQNTISEEIYDFLIDKTNGIDKKTALAFKKLYDFVEFKKPISKKILNRFIQAGIYDPQEKKIKNPEDGFGLILQTLVYSGFIDMRCKNGKFFRVEQDSFKERKN